MQTRELIRSHDGTQLLLRRDAVENAKGTVVIVHGLGEHGERYDWVARQLNDAGFSVYRHDHRGHGRSGGARGYILDFNELIDDTHMVVNMAKDENPDLPIFMLGHSMGGFITAAYGVKYPDGLAGQILSGPCVTVLPIFEGLRAIDVDAAPLELADNALSDLICRDRDVVRDYTEDHLVLMDFTQKMLKEVFVNGAQWLSDSITQYRYPCLIMHGGDDQIVPPDNTKFMYSHSDSEDKTMIIWPDLYHEILNEKEEKASVMKTIVDWIDERI